ncbi:F-box domain-containing protein [Annulohypoxylon truncatum]|uniref:F-box domain-containing protein n=1 Tax=Annulohypoxylon truncatum TaxID=327061 RepID=UPI0020088B50|nr:F-box domain-containing protein [Annulohypoxylon truncatum]KAI1209697.1 F-box domain-containing protein [Annulohypoxylon truncatum]
MVGPSHLENLPDEIFLHILSFLEARDVVILQSVSKHFLGLCRDGNFWRNKCLSTPSVRERIRLFWSGSDWIDEEGATLSGAPTTGEGSQIEDQNEVHWSRLESLSQLSAKRRKREKIRIAANWDPTFPNENTNWYNEYIQRYGPIAISWFEQPQIPNGSRRDQIDVSGAALYSPNSTGNELFAVSPLEDGSICLWDVKGTRCRKGSILLKSSPGLLCADGSGADLLRRSKMTNTGVTECVSVDSKKNMAFFAVQSRLIEVDLETLQIVGNHPFEWSITTLSAADPGVPLTVGTVNGLHLHDFRARSKYREEYQIRLDAVRRNGLRDFSHVLDPRPLDPYASLAQSGPQSILHLERSGDGSQLSDDIFVAGRFSNILHYDRRMFPAIRGSIHSGAKLCSLTSLPYPFSSLNSDLRRRFQLSEEQVEKSKSVTGGRTLIACGEYNTKGSLELYGLSSGSSNASQPRVIHESTMKNRQAASQSKLLSVINHGTRLVFSDGQGYLKWVERDGFTEVRRHKIGKSERIIHRSLFGSMPGSDDIARKILSTRTPGQDGEARVNDDDILFWTGEKLGLLSFSSEPGFSPEDFDEHPRTPEEIAAEEEEHMYAERMRLALERQARDVRFVQNLGAGNIHSGI